MRSSAARLGVLGAAIAAAIVLFIVLSDSGDDGENGATATATDTNADGSAPANAAQVITIKDGEPVGGVKTLTYDKGDQVNLEVRLDQPEEEVHIHGYEIEKPAETSPVMFSFPAKIDGIFEIEVHLAGGGENQIAELRVNP